MSMTIGTISRSRRVATRAWWIACSSPSSAACEVPGQRLDAAAEALRQRRPLVGAGGGTAATRGGGGLAVEVVRMSGCPAVIVLWASMRLAAIDIGTNSVHMIVAQVRPDQSFEIIDREKEMVRLGAGGLDGRALTPAAMAGGLEALSKFRRLADSHKVDEIIAAATSATREAENGGDFLAAVRDRTGIDVRVISGAEEARLIHIAATYGIDLGKRHGVVIDIGGGSVEITLGAAREPALAKSFKVGVIRLTERFVRGDPIARRDERRLVEHIEAAIGAARRPDRRDAATSASSAPRARSSASAASRSPPTAATSSTTCTTGACRPSRIHKAAQGARRLRSGGAPADGRGWIRGAPTWRWPARCCSTPSSAASAPTRSRCARWPCAKG